MSVMQRVNRLEVSITEQKLKDAKEIWDFPDYAHTLLTIAFDNKELLTDEGQKIAAEYKVSWDKAHADCEPPPTEGLERLPELHKFFVDRCTKDEKIRPYIRNFDTLRADLERDDFNECH